MPGIALATSSKYPNLTDDDRLLVQPLAEHGLVAQPGIWTDHNFPWSSCDAVVIRSCWDYHLKSGEFLRWIASLEKAGIVVLNAPALIRWNTSKAYLRDLESRGVTIVPTVWPESGLPMDLRDCLQRLGWQKAVIKPRISATAYRTQLVIRNDARCAQDLFDDLRHGVGVMLQKFVDRISEEGEWSLIFFMGEFSHAVVKTPRAGDFRVQNDFGGISRTAEPPACAMESATRILRLLEPTVYARVDGVVQDNQFLLMELELIEPALFLDSHPEAPSHFAKAIAQSISARL
jgi:glutathione synthase/RimK-type ligase-like ATP-grasp enzyme